MKLVMFMLIATSSSLHVQEFQDYCFKSRGASGYGLQTWATLTATSTLHCAVKCLLQDRCEAIYHIWKIKLCRIHNTTTEITLEDKKESKGKYFYKQKDSLPMKIYPEQMKVKGRILMAQHRGRRLYQYNLKNNQSSKYEYVHMSQVSDVKYVVEMKTLFFAHGYTKKGRISSVQLDKGAIKTIRELKQPSALCVVVERRSIFVGWMGFSSSNSNLGQMNLNGQSFKVILTLQHLRYILSIACSRDEIFFRTKSSLSTYDIIYKNVTSFTARGQSLYLFGDKLYYNHWKDLLQYDIVKRNRKLIESLQGNPKSVLVHGGNIYVTFDRHIHSKMIDVVHKSVKVFGRMMMTGYIMTLIT